MYDGRRFAPASWTSLNVATEEMKHSARRSAIIALLVIHGLFFEAVANAIVFAGVDNKLHNLLRFVQPTLPLLLPVCTFHRPNM
jgi:hypothetical protein